MGFRLVLIWSLFLYGLKTKNSFYIFKGLVKHPHREDYVTVLYLSSCLCSVIQMCQTLTLGDPIDCSLPGSIVHRMFQARILEWVTIPSSSESSWSTDWTWRRERLPTSVFWPREFHGLYSSRSQRVGHDWVTFNHSVTCHSKTH